MTDLAQREEVREALTLMRHPKVDGALEVFTAAILNIENPQSRGVKEATPLDASIALIATIRAAVLAEVAGARKEERATTQQLREALAELIQRVDAVGHWQRGTNPVTDQHRRLASPERAP